jgi:hypothetical protein
LNAGTGMSFALFKESMSYHEGFGSFNDFFIMKRTSWEQTAKVPVNGDENIRGRGHFTGRCFL